MVKFSRHKTRPNVTAPVRTRAGAADRLTAEGAPAFGRDAKSELFLLAVTNMVSERTFYEAAAERDERFVALVHAVTAQDPEWMARFIPWLRTAALLRSASVSRRLSTSLPAAPAAARSSRPRLRVRTSRQSFLPTGWGLTAAGFRSRSSVVWQMPSSRSTTSTPR